MEAAASLSKAVIHVPAMSLLCTQINMDGRKRALERNKREMEAERERGMSESPLLHLAT
jgi:hypothetical protein